MDGGTHVNNPAAAAMASAIQLWGDEPLKILSLGTGLSFTTLDGKESQGWGALGWVTEGGIIDICMDGTANTTEYIMDSLKGRGIDTTRVQVALPDNTTKMDDASAENIARLKVIGGQLVEVYSAAIDAFATGL